MKLNSTQLSLLRVYGDPEVALIAAGADPGEFLYSPVPHTRLQVLQRVDARLARETAIVEEEWDYLHGHGLIGEPYSQSANTSMTGSGALQSPLTAKGRAALATGEFEPA